MTVILVESNAPQLEFWDNLLQGSIGSVISILGLFVVFLLTRLHDRSLQKTEHERDEESQRIRETAEAVAHVVQVALPLRGLKPSLDEDAQCRELSGELTLLGIRLAHYYPEFQQWTYHESTQMLEIAGYLRKDKHSLKINESPNEEDGAKISSDIPELYELSLKAASWEAGYIVSRLTFWASIKFDRDYVWRIPEKRSEE